MIEPMATEPSLTKALQEWDAALGSKYELTPDELELRIAFLYEVELTVRQIRGDLLAALQEKLGDA
jgi:hypothetical protein